MKENITQDRPGTPGPEPQGGSFISLGEASERTKRFREDYILRNNDQEEKIKGNYFAKEQLLQVLNQPGCEGIRIYNSVRQKVDKDPESGEMTNRRDVIIVGVDKERDDLLEVQPRGGCNPLGVFMAPASAEKQAGLLLANPDPCPNICGKSNGLNGNI